MSTQQVASQAASIDWNIVAGAIATFIVSWWVAWSGRQKAKKEQEAEEKSPTPVGIAGATLQDNYTLLQSAEATRNLTEAMNLTRNSIDRLRDENLELKIEIERLTRKLGG